MQIKRFVVLLFGAAMGGCVLIQTEAPSSPPLCSGAWYQSVEDRLPSGDGQGHGPDIGSDEWKSVIEFHLGVREDPQWPHPDSLAWCAAVEAWLTEAN